jgi:hypothetical protein
MDQMEPLILGLPKSITTMTHSHCTLVNQINMTHFRHTWVYKLTIRYPHLGTSADLTKYHHTLGVQLTMIRSHHIPDDS